MVGCVLLTAAPLTSTLAHDGSPSIVRCQVLPSSISCPPAVEEITSTTGRPERALGYDAHMAEDVINEIVATVLEVSVKAGQRVEVGDTLVLLESMKMEIPVLAEDAGVLDEVKVNVGDVIQAGDIIASYQQD